MPRAVSIRRSLIALSALLLTPSAGVAQPFLVAGTGCLLGRADERGLHRVYWELLNLTEVCLETPVTPPYLKLSFVLVFQGKAVTGAPVSILLRVQGRAWVGPDLPTGSLTVGDRRLDVISSTRRHELAFPCPPGEPCAFDGVVAAMTAEEIRLIAQSPSASGQLFGASFTIPPDSLRAVRHLVPLIERAK